MIKKLLVALDGSNHSLKAADVACTIAAGLKAEVILLCVVKPQELPKGLRDYANLEHISGLDIDILLKVAGDLVTNAEKSARKMGVDDVIGSLEPGKIADVIITTGDPMQAGTRTVGSFLAGRPIELTSLHEEHYHKFSKRPQPDLKDPGPLRGPPPMRASPAGSSRDTD